MPYRSDDLVSAVRMRCQLPTAANDGKFTDLNILELAYEELLTYVLPEVRKARGNYYVRSLDYAVASGVSDYSIPPRAQGASLRDVTYIDPNGNGWSIPEIPLEDSDYYKSSGSTWWSTAYVYTIEGNKVRLRPEPTREGTLRLRYYERPGRLVPVSEAMKVAGFGPNPNQVQGDVPLTWTNANIFDSLSAGPTFDTFGMDATAAVVTAGVGGSIDFTDPYPSELAVGDYIALATESPVVQLTVELQPVLTSATVVRVLEALGDLQGVGVAQAKMERQMGQAVAHIQPRNDGEQPRIINRRGPLRFSRRWQ
tara:strand:+ start:867 stop:1799 length:933 start_codon:yes stop_codon:yes gene_type:complete